MAQNVHYVCILFCLLPDKKIENLQDNFWEDKCRTEGDGMLKEIVTVDFEAAIHNAVSIGWPTVYLKADFIFAKSWWVLCLYKLNEIIFCMKKLSVSKWSNSLFTQKHVLSPRSVSCVRGRGVPIYSRPSLATNPFPTRLADVAMRPWL